MNIGRPFFIATALFVAGRVPARPLPDYSMKINWSDTLRISTTQLSLMAGPPPQSNPKAYRQAIRAIKALGPNYYRFVAWYPTPGQSVAELKPPRHGKTCWNFTPIDPAVKAARRLAGDHPWIMNFSTIPEWMFITPKPVPIPTNPNQWDWGYEQGTKLRDPSLKELSDYYQRLVSWYTRGGFKDEYGRWHQSGHHYIIPYWEVLNEPDLEHLTTAAQYTRRYDAIVEAIQKVDTKIKFIGLALGFPSPHPEYFSYFLNHTNHKPGIPIDMISYHFYAMPEPNETPAAEQSTVFNQTDQFLKTVRSIEAVRKKLSPETGTDIDETGIMPQKPTTPYPDWFWNLSAASWAYLYGNLNRLGINVVTMTGTFIYSPFLFTSLTLVNLKGELNARYWVLRLLHANLRPGDRIVKTHWVGLIANRNVFAQAYLTPAGQRLVLLINKKNEPVKVSIFGLVNGKEQYIDVTTPFHRPLQAKVQGDSILLQGFSVAIVTGRFKTNQ